MDKTLFFMQRAIILAQDNVSNNNGGPFGALVVKNGEIIGIGVNEVTKNHDPTAHAEIQAIRAASLYLNDFQLTECEIYTSSEPCPMCIGAIYWARPKAVYFGFPKEVAAKAGFDDQLIYNELKLPVEKRKFRMEQVIVDAEDSPFKIWLQSKNKKAY